MAELTSKTITELRDGFRAGEFSAREIADSFNAAVAEACPPFVDCAKAGGAIW